MSRKGQTKIREVLPDTEYKSIVITKLINRVMYAGNKNAAQKQVYEALKLFQKESKSEDIVTTLEQALDNIKPKVEVRPRRIGGAVYQVPTPVRGSRQYSLAIRWLVTSARKRPNKQYHSFALKLAAELLATLNNEGSSIAKRQEIERMAEANKAFAHLRW
ncbi:MAG: 30S ribosomal protein S7 [Candidatus Shapirobacteria bacterium GW2011_GWE1_38_10]|uniref:Small ribosomal subunit protein uS7 n=1 Tax=Candidatus Shapirobacteria bacterium GW2011_GWE1_38_10 TaxID=1618488 RepID=A0A0G0KLT7_9BACT|nr:MAG: 30S ribosomal protein S7 [Candidatus Shapirobacteria bacterium GW2011_GWF2_37_20]KKQ50129.1 MAG: 30S ribosomal protein S7 [Candidatus Shapirobacteria bacterium GW2011_GWE1_38_10]KKQ63934.1 MAG: 30S ribosomal protein S7 [Candidatus Shapirobacteria bacterium GW2011_GWF1_38_23]